MSFKRKPKTFIFDSPQALAQQLSKEFQEEVQESERAGRLFHIALSGGSAPRPFYRLLSRPRMCLGIPWRTVHVYWADERCVSQDSPDSNFKLAWESFLKFVPVPKENIHRVPGEESPERGCRLYGEMLEKHLPKNREGLPCFDWVLLGAGSDGHTASLFPGQEMNNEAPCLVTHHPDSGQMRISLGLDVLSSADKVSFIVTGEDKAGIVSDILENSSSKLPAKMVSAQKMEWWLDSASASRLSLP